DRGPPWIVEGPRDQPDSRAGLAHLDLALPGHRRRRYTPPTFFPADGSGSRPAPGRPPNGRTLRSAPPRGAPSPVPDARELRPAADPPGARAGLLAVAGRAERDRRSAPQERRQGRPLRVRHGAGRGRTHPPLDPLLPRG